MISEPNNIILKSFKKELNIPESFNKILEKNIYKINLDIGEKINEFGELIPGIIFIKEGTIRCTFLTEEKEIITIRKYFKNEIIGKSHFINRYINFSLSASTSVTAYILPNKILVDVFKNNKTYDSFKILEIEELFYLIYQSKGNSKKDPYKDRKSVV